MANDNQLPLQVSGPLPKDCYSDLNEFVADLAKVLELPLDTAIIIKGANGERGVKGERGPKGDQGPKGDSRVLVQYSLAIGAGVAFVEFNYFQGWEAASYMITYDGAFAALTGNNFVPASGLIGVGTIVPVFAVPTPTKLRCYFVFAGGVTSTPDNKFLLKISILQ